MADHDALFKAVISEFFLDFMQLFFPAIAQDIEPDSIQEKEQELLTDFEGGTTNRVDIIRQVRLKQSDTLILVLIEPQSYEDKAFGERLSRYFIRLWDKYRLPVFPVAVFSYDNPKTVAPSTFTITIADYVTIVFNYATIQLNQLAWRDFADKPNPISYAFMSKMSVKKRERAKAKVAALGGLTELELNEAQQQLISAFIDTYLKLDEKEKQQFEQEVQKFGKGKQEAVMELTTSWKEEGIKQGLERGKLEGKLTMTLQLVAYRFGALNDQEAAQISGFDEAQLERLAQALFDFKSRDDLVIWLKQSAQ